MVSKSDLLIRALLAVWLCASSASAEPSTDSKIPRVVIVSSSEAEAYRESSAEVAREIKSAVMAAIVEPVALSGGTGRGVAEALRDPRPDLVITLGTAASEALIEARYDGPVLFSMVLFPRESRLPERVRHSAGGVMLDIPLEMQFQSLRELAPDARKIGVLFHAGETGSVIEAARGVAAQYEFELIAREVGDSTRAIETLEALLPGVDLVWSVADSHVFSPRVTEGLLLAALRRRVPFVGISQAQVRAGAVAALYCDYGAIGRQTGRKAVGILQDDPAARSIDPPERVSLALNLRSAERCGLTPSAELRARATEVFQ